MACDPKGNENENDNKNENDNENESKSTEIGRWIEESISDENIAKWIKIWCEDQETFIECAEAFPNGSKDLLAELLKKQNGLLIEKQRAAIGKLFVKIESARNAQKQNDSKMDLDKLSNEIHNLSKKVESFGKVIEEQNRFKYNLAQLDNMSDATSESRDLAGFKDIVKSGYKFKNAKCQITGTEEDPQISDIWKDVVKPHVNSKDECDHPLPDESQVFYRLYSGKFDSIQVKLRNGIVGAHIVGGKNTFVGLLMNYGRGRAFRPNGPRNGLLMTKLFETFFDLQMFTLIPKYPLKPSDREYKVFVLYYRSAWEKENNIQNNSNMSNQQLKSPAIFEQYRKNAQAEIDANQAKKQTKWRKKIENDSDMKDDMEIPELYWHDKIDTGFKDGNIYHKISLPSGSPKLSGQYWFPEDAIEQLYKFDGATLKFYGSELRPYSRALKHHCKNSTKNATIKKWIEEKQAQILEIQFIESDDGSDYLNANSGSNHSNDR